MCLAWLVSQSFWVFQVGGKGQSQQRDRGEEVAVSCCLITAVWEVLCTWRSPARRTPWRRRSLSARRWSSSGPPEPCACEEEARDRRQMRSRKKCSEKKREQHLTRRALWHNFFLFSTVKATGSCQMTKQSHVLSPVESPWIRTVNDEYQRSVMPAWNRNTCFLLTFGFVLGNRMRQ